MFVTLLRRPLRRVAETWNKPVLHFYHHAVPNLVVVGQSIFASVGFTDFGVGAGARCLGIGRV